MVHNIIVINFDLWREELCMKWWHRTWWRDTNARQYIYKRGCGVLPKCLMGQTILTKHYPNQGRYMGICWNCKLSYFLVSRCRSSTSFVLLSRWGKNILGVIDTCSILFRISSKLVKPWSKSWNLFLMSWYARHSKGTHSFVFVTFKAT